MASKTPTTPPSGGTLEQVLVTASRASATLSTSAAAAEGELLLIELDSLDDNPYQPRSVMDEAKLEELAASVAQSGLLQPILVRPKASGRYTIVAGHRRVAAFRLRLSRAETDEERKRYARIIAHVRLALGDAEMAVGAYVENAQRADLNPVEEAASLLRIKELTGVTTTKELAERVGQNEQRLRRVLRLNEAPAIVKAGVTDGILVPVSASRSEEGGKERRERRRLEMLAAIEFVRLYEHLMKKRPKAAEERTAAAIQRALSEGWGLRRIQEYVEAVLAGRPAADGEEAEGNGRAPKALFERSPQRLIVHVPRLSAASEEQVASLRAVLEDLLAQLGAATVGGPARSVSGNQR